VFTALCVTKADAVGITVRFYHGVLILRQCALYRFPAQTAVRAQHLDQTLAYTELTEEGPVSRRP